MPLQKYILHPITALLLGWGVARFVGHYHLLEFSGASGICFALFAVAYLLLSRKYDLVLSIVFLVVALGIFTQSWQMKTLTTSVETTDKTAIRQLSLIIALTKAYKISHGRFPEKIEDLTLSDLNPSSLSFAFKKSSVAEDTGFIITAHNKSDDKSGQFWYMTDSFEFFARPSPR